MSHTERSFIRFAPIIAVLLIPNIITAQDLGEQDFIAPLGTTWEMRALQSVPNSGRPEFPMVWHFSDLISNDVFGVTYTVKDPLEVPGNQDFAGADRVLEEVHHETPSDVVNTFYQISPAAGLELGSIGPVATTHFVMPATVYRFPMAAGTSEEATFCFNSTNQTGTSAFCGTTRISHVTQGRLELPFGTLENVHLIATRWAIYNTNGLEDSTYVMHEEWYAPGTPFPVLRSSTYIAADGSLSRRGQIMDEASIVGLNDLAMERSMNVYPVPSTGPVNVETFTGENRLQILAADGRMVRNENLIGAGGVVALDLSDLPAGAYHLILNSSTARRSSTVVLTH